MHKEVIKNTYTIANETGFEILGLDFSPIKGPEGNIEFLLYLSKPAVQNENTDFIPDETLIDKTVFNAHNM